MQRIMRLTIHLSNGKVTEYHPADVGGQIADDLRAKGTQVDVDSGWVDWQPDLFHNGDGHYEKIEEMLGTKEYDQRDRARIVSQWGHEG